MTEAAQKWPLLPQVYNQKVIHVGLTHVGKTGSFSSKLQESLIEKSSFSVLS